MNVKLTEQCVYVLLLCLALLVNEIMAINHGVILAVRDHLLGINSLTFKPIKQSSDELLEKQPKTSKLIDDMVYQRFFNQKIDHFNFSDDRTWLQRFYVSKKHLKGATPSPVILLLGGLQELTYADFKSGVWDEMAREAGALLLCLEHRYRGLSEPRDDLNTYNLLYLTSEQALADAAVFISKVQTNELLEYVNAKDITNWIVVGASHGGALAAKLKLKFPHLLVGALAVDAPLLAIEKFTEYYEAVFSELRKNRISKEAVDVAYATIQYSITDVTTRLAFRETFNLCDHKGMDYKTEDIQLLLWSISTLLGLAVQPKTLDPNSIKDEIINILENKSYGYELERFGKAIRTILSKYFISCMNINYADAVRSYTEISWNSPIDDLLYFGLGDRQDLYQSCTQFGQFEVYDPFVPLTFYGNLCVAVFGTSYGLYNLQQGVIRTNMFYGGLEMSVGNVYFISHSLDYFIRLGITDNKPKNSEAVCINAPFYIANEVPGWETPIRNDEWNEIVSKLKQWSKLTKMTKVEEVEEVEEVTKRTEVTELSESTDLSESD